MSAEPIYSNVGGPPGEYGRRRPIGTITFVGQQLAEAIVELRIFPGWVAVRFADGPPERTERTLWFPDRLVANVNV